MTPDSTTYTTDLAEYVDKKINSWLKQKKEFLELKFQKNFEAVTNQDYRLQTWKKGEGTGWRSRTWIGFVRVKIWTLYSVFVDTILQGGNVPFDLTPDPSETEDNMSEEYIEDRDNRIASMKRKIKSQLKLRKADREYLLKWLSGAYYGMAFSKFDVDPVVSRQFKQVDMGLDDVREYLSPEEAAQYVRFERTAESEDVPGHRYVSVWNMVWDMEYGNLRDGEGYAESIPSSTADLKDLKNKPGFIKNNIQRVIDEHREKVSGAEDQASMTPGLRNIRDRQRKHTRYEYYMLAPRKLVESFEKTMKSRHKTDTITLGSLEDYALAESSGDMVEIMGEIAEREIIRHVRNETGKRNHHMFMMETALDESHGNGVADNMEDVQASLVGMIRAFEDNKKLSANVTAAIKSRFFVNPSQLDDIVPGKKYEIADTCPDVRQAILPIVWPDVGESLVSGIGMMERWKDDVSMIPTILQGFNLPKQKADTAFEISQMMENSGKYIGMLVRNNDEQLIEPEITDIYEYNMLYDPDESIKCNCQVTAEGFTGFRNKIIRGEAIKNILAMVLSSEYLMGQVKMPPHLEPIYESLGFNPDDFIKSEEELEEDAQRQAEREARAKQEAIEAMSLEKQLDAQGKIAVEEAKTEGKLEEIDAKGETDIEEEVVKGEIEADASEEEFKHEVILKAMEPEKTESKPKT